MPLSEKLKLFRVDSNGSYDAGQLVGGIYDSFQSYKKDRCAIFVEYEQIIPFLKSSSLEADFLDANANFRWTGAPETLKRRWKRFIIGDYIDWFCWFMKWQRFNAFHVLVLVRPIGFIINSESRGYLDGFLTRLINKPTINSVLVVEEGRFEPVINAWLGESAIQSAELSAKFGTEQFEQSILATLYGTMLSRKQLAASAGRTISAKLSPDWRLALTRIEHSQLIRRSHRWFRSLGEDEMKTVEHMSSTHVSPERNLPDGLFRLREKRGHPRIDADWLREWVLIFVEKKGGWFTIPELYEDVRDGIQRIAGNSDGPPRMLGPDYIHPGRPPNFVLLPSMASLRNLVEAMVTEGQLQRSVWFREIGRPVFVYHSPGQQLPFSMANRCGQCALYISLRRRCRLWWLLDQTFGYGNPRWSKELEGTHPLSPFEVYKMRNSWRISSHSTACPRFIDKKRDYTRKDVPESCDICGRPLPKSRTVACTNCRTAYFKVKNRVRVLTSYEHEFERVYRGIGGTDPASDLQQLREKKKGLVPEILEEIEYEQHRRDAQPTVMLYPEDRMVVRDCRLFLFRRNSVESLPLSGTVIVDHGVIDAEQRETLESAGATVRTLAPRPAEVPTCAGPSHDLSPSIGRVVQEHPEFVRRLARAMIDSAIHATERIGLVAGLTKGQVESFTNAQSRLLTRLERASTANRLAVYEALAMRQYWDCYDLVLSRAFERSGHRKRSRFVRELIGNPVGRAKGYTASDAAINYIHQRRLFKSRSINVGLGLRWSPGEGFLHRRRWNSKGLGLTLDLIDPFKFADREELMKAILGHRLSWRDFYSAVDRRGIRFYYPKPDAVNVLETVSGEADGMQVDYLGASMTLTGAYERSVSELMRSLQTGSTSSFVPFVYPTVSR